jgi:hypothetical protein
LDESRRDRIVVSASKPEIWIGPSIELADPAHADFAHVFPNDGCERDWKVSRVGVHLESNLPDCFDRVTALALPARERAHRRGIEATEARSVVADAADHAAHDQERNPVTAVHAVDQIFEELEVDGELVLARHRSGVQHASARDAALDVDNAQSRTANEAVEQACSERGIPTEGGKREVDPPALLRSRCIGTARLETRLHVREHAIEEAVGRSRGAVRRAPKERQRDGLREPHPTEAARFLAVGEPEPEASVAEHRAGVAGGF